jgi:hypothetical protein
MNYVSIENLVEYVYNGWRTWSTRFIKREPLVSGSATTIRLGERVSDHLISATNLWTDGYNAFFFDELGNNRRAMRPSMAGS